MLICMQKNQLQCTSFLRYFKKIANLLFWVIWACLNTHTQYQYERTFMFIYRLKIGFILHVFLEILQGYYKLVILRILRIVGHITQSDIINFQKILLFICKQKINFIPYVFWGYCKDANLFWVLLVSLTKHTQNDNISMQKMSMFICMPRINFIICFFLEILHFKESCNLIDQQYFGSMT